MKSIVLCRLACVLICLAGSPVFAQVNGINQFKTTVYTQTNSSPPIAPNFPNAYFSGTYVITDPRYPVTNLVANTPNGDVWDFIESNPSYFYFNSDYYDNVTNFDQDFPGGTFVYDFDFTATNTNLVHTDIIFDCSTNDLNAAQIPAFTPACWTAMQAVDPAQDFTLTWNSYDLTEGADYDYTFLAVSDAITGNTVFGPSIPFDNIISSTIPAGTLQYGRLYNVTIYFSERQEPMVYGEDSAEVLVGWDNLTQTTLSTLPLWLQIAPAGTNVVLTWPSDATSYHLESSASLSTSESWSVVTNIPTVSGTTNFLTLPALNAASFFRLASVGN